MKSCTIKFQFDDEFYEELSKLAENLDISIAELIGNFIDEGIASSWGAFEHEAKQMTYSRKERFLNPHSFN